MEKKLNILFEDEHLLAINKPAMMLSIPDRFDQLKENCFSILKTKYGEIFVVHRLDKDTSGVLIFAKNAETHQSLNTLFETHKMEKVYWAIVNGTPAQQHGSIDYSIAADPQKPGKMKIYSKGKSALSEYTVLENYRSFSLLEVKIHTGRTHQIRVHLAGIGHSLAVDAMYGKRAQLTIFDIKPKAKVGAHQEEVRPLIARCSLHARSLSFQHPHTGQNLCIEAALPKDFKAVLQQLQKL
jgi:23S rRNA pseudouridine1911/1915/1917 synthase